MLPVEASISSNFLYGRPALDRTHSPYSGSIRPIGYYYEDDTPYEQSSQNLHTSGQDSKSIFLGADSSSNAVGAGSINEIVAETSDAEILGDGLNNNQSILSINNGGNSTISATRELEQRLLHVQQHIYRPRED